MTAEIEFSDLVIELEAWPARPRPRRYIKPFVCRKCKKNLPGTIKVIAARRDKVPGIVPWCLWCVAAETSTWEYLRRE